MKISAKYKAQRLEKVAAAKKIFVGAEAAGRLMTEAETKNFDELHAEAEAFEPMIKRAELLEKGEEEAAALQPSLLLPSNNAVDHTPTVSRDQMADFMTPSPIGPKVWGRLRNATSIKEAYRFGVWFLAAIGIGFAQKKAKDMFEPMAVSNESTNTQGGYLVTEEFLPTIISLVEKQGVLRRKAMIIPMSTDQVVMPRDTGGLTAYPVGESAVGTESTATWDQVSLVAQKWMVLTRMSSEVNEDSIVSLGDWLLGKCALAFATAEDAAGFNGDGSSTYAGIVGFKNALGASCKVTQGTSNTWAAQVLADFNNLQAKGPDYQAAMQNEFYANKSYYHQVMARLAFAGGGNTTIQIIDGIQVGQFFGFNVNFVSCLPRVTATTGICVYYGDIANAAKFGDRRKVTISTSSEASIGGHSMYERDQIGIKATERFDFVVHERGTTTSTDAGGAMNCLITG